jgi:hypothetical protein
MNVDQILSRNIIFPEDAERLRTAILTCTPLENIDEILTRNLIFPEDKDRIRQMLSCVTISRADLMRLLKKAPKVEVPAVELPKSTEFCDNKQWDYFKSILPEGHPIYSKISASASGNPTFSEFKTYIDNTKARKELKYTLIEKIDAMNIPSPILDQPQLEQLLDVIYNSGYGDKIGELIETHFPKYVNLKTHIINEISTNTRSKILKYNKDLKEIIRENILKVSEVTQDNNGIKKRIENELMKHKKLELLFTGVVMEEFKNIFEALVTKTKMSSILQEFYTVENSVMSLLDVPSRQLVDDFNDNIKDITTFNFVFDDLLNEAKRRVPNVIKPIDRNDLYVIDDLDVSDIQSPQYLNEKLGIYMKRLPTKLSDSAKRDKIIAVNLFRKEKLDYNPCALEASQYSYFQSYIKPEIKAVISGNVQFAEGYGLGYGPGFTHYGLGGVNENVERQIKQSFTNSKDFKGYVSDFDISGFQEYAEGAIRVVDSAKEYFKDWVVRIYIDVSLFHKGNPEFVEIWEPMFRAIKEKDNVELIVVDFPAGKVDPYFHHQFVPVIFRYLPIFDDTVDAVIVRDIDSCLTDIDYFFVNEWLKSDKDLHSYLMCTYAYDWHNRGGGGKIRPWAGLWGYKGNKVNEKLWENMYNFAAEASVGKICYGFDEWVLADIVFPYINSLKPYNTCVTEISFGMQDALSLEHYLKIDQNLFKLIKNKLNLKDGNITSMTGNEAVLVQYLIRNVFKDESPKSGDDYFSGGSNTGYFAGAVDDQENLNVFSMNRNYIHTFQMILFKIAAYKIDEIDGVKIDWKSVRDNLICHRGDITGQWRTIKWPFVDGLALFGQGDWFNNEYGKGLYDCFFQSPVKKEIMYPFNSLGLRKDDRFKAIPPTNLSPERKVEMTYCRNNNVGTTSFNPLTGGRINSRSDEYYRRKYLKYKQKYMTHKLY